MSIASLIRQMAEAGAPAEAIALAVEAIEASEAKEAERRARQAARKAKSRAVVGQECDSHGTVTGQVCDTPPSPSLPPHTPPSRPHPPAGSLREREGADLRAEFDEEFWPRYPHKVGKPDAQRKFVAARRSARLPEIMAGLERYIASKPADRPWCNPATWLNQARWADEPAALAPSLRVVNGQGPPRTDRERLMDVGRRMLAEERGEVEPPHWQGSTIDGQAHRRQ